MVEYFCNAHENTSDPGCVACELAADFKELQDKVVQHEKYIEDLEHKCADLKYAHKCVYSFLTRETPYVNSALCVIGDILLEIKDE